MNMWAALFVEPTPPPVVVKPKPKPRNYTFGPAKCAFCGKDFIKKSPTGTTCSEPCRAKMKYMAQAIRRKQRAG